MTHLSRAHLNESADFSITNTQLELFQDSVHALKLSPSTIRHASNSASIIKFNGSHFDMVRVGDCLYGADIEGLNKEFLFKQVFQSFKTSVAMIIENIPKSTPVGYGGLQFTSSHSSATTATIRIGFDYGIPKDAYKNELSVLIRGQKFPIIGATSMSMTIVDITSQSKHNLI